MIEKIYNRIKGVIKHKRSLISIEVTVTIALVLTVVMVLVILVNPTKPIEVFTNQQDANTVIANKETVSAEKIDTTGILPVISESTKSSKTESIKAQNQELTLKDGTIINSNDLIGKLDKTSDETINYVYNKLPNNIEVRDLYEGGFSNSKYNELLVIFKFSPGVHVSGLDFSVAAVYDRKTLKLVSQKSFTSDECQFDVVRDVKKVAYLVYSGTTTYQGHSTCTLQLFNLSKNWEQLLPQEKSIYGEDKYKFELISNGLISVLKPEFLDNDVVEWKKEYYLKWNEKTSKLEDFIPKTLSDTKVHKYFDINSTSPNGKYAIVSHEWGFDDGSYILIYDITQNKLIDKYDVLAQEMDYSWSSDSKKVAVIRVARTWIDTSIIDIKKNSVVSMMDNGLAGFSQFKALGVKFDYELDENRPDPYYQICDWSQDSKKVLMFYQWSDSDGNRQNGNFVYDLDKQVISKITQNKPMTEGGNLEPKKPKGFKW